MSLTLAVAARDRILVELARDGTPISEWERGYGGTLKAAIGYRHPASADGWPFVSLIPTRDTRSLRTGKGDAAELAVVCGYRLAQVSRGEDDGLLAVDALADAVLAALSLPWRAQWAGRTWDARTAERTGITLAHPNYELDLAVSFGRPGEQ